MTGIDRTTRAFEARSGLKIMAHAVCGYPDALASARILAAMAAAGADIIEAQLPFSDPSADGSSIVQANHAARLSGSRTEGCLGSLETLRLTTDAPILIMSYINPILAYGVDAIIARAVRSGLDGFIVPDYPDDEGELGLAEKCAAEGLALVPLIAPTTSLDRAEALAAASSSPFLYVVLRLGVTGRKTEIDSASLRRLADLKTRTRKFIAAGFGLREASQITALEGSADCAIVGSALVDAARSAIADGKDPAQAVGSTLRTLAGR